MPLRMKITSLTLYEEDDSIFDGLTENLPSRPFERSQYYDDLFLSGFDIDSQTLIDGILIECGQMNVLYTDPDFFKFTVANWAKRNKYNWQRLYETMFFKYNPIWNKDGTIKDSATETRNLLNELTQTRETTNDRTINEDIDIIDTDDTLETVNLTDNTTNNLIKNNGIVEKSTTESETNNTGTEKTLTDVKTEEKVAAYNITDYTNRNKTISNTDSTRTDNLKETNDSETNTNRTESGTENTTEEVKHTGTDKTERDYHRTHENDTTISDDGEETVTNSGTDSGTIKNESEHIEQGNIGVTMTQSMIEEERKIVKYSIYDTIIQDFKVNFCLLIY